MRDLVIDAWSALSHKAPLVDDAKARLSGYTAKSWVGDEHRRRVTAYQVLAAYDANVSRMFLDTTDATDIEERREYGDAGLVIDTVLSALLGEDQEIVVDGADDHDPELEEPTPPTPADGATAVTPEQQAAYDADLAAWQENQAAAVLAERQQFLRTWADDVHLQLRLVDCERNAVRYGDGVWLLGWDPEKRRPVPAMMDPGFYFPVLPDTLDAYAYPDRVHFAWEIPGEDFPDGKTRVRRITYDLRDMRGEWVPQDAAPGAGPDDPNDPDVLVIDGQRNVWTLPEGSVEVVGPDGMTRVVRDYPWNDEPSTKACYQTDATWLLDDLNDPENVDAFTLEGAVIRQDAEGNEIEDLDLGIDFLPVVHIPNTPPGGDHYGQSSLARVLQIIDDLQGADTDAQASSATTGSPITWSTESGVADAGHPLTGSQAPTTSTRQVGPGTHWKLGTDGKAGVIDTSGNLKATRDYVISLRDRMLTNSRLPATVVGTVKASEYPSGYALQLSFGPLTAMIRQMRLVRAVKYPLLLKMVQRFYQAYEGLDPGATPRAELRLGSFLPSDMAGTLDRVQKAYDAHLISLETAVSELLEAGFSIDDVAEEVMRIQERDFEGANELADATGDNAAVRDYLHLDPPASGIPTIVLPQPGGE